MRTSLAVLMATAVLIVLGLSAGSASAAIKVQEFGIGGSTLAKFDKLKCEKGKIFSAKGRDGKWRFELLIRKPFFSGFDQYEIEYGMQSGVNFEAWIPNDRPGSDNFFSNIIKPDTGSDPELTVGGGVDFSKRGRDVKLQFPLAYNRYTNPDIVSVGGSASCKY
jgi:hypothetical protein